MYRYVLGPRGIEGSVNFERVLDKLLSDFLLSFTTMLRLQHACKRHVLPVLSRANTTLQTGAEGSAQIPPSLLSAKSSATVSTDDASTSTVPSSEKEKPSETKETQSPESSGGSKPRSKAIGPRRRPNISLENPRKWNPPVKKGLLPAYDEAVNLIEQDSSKLKKEAAELRKRLDVLSGGTTGALNEDTEAESIRKKLSILDVQAYINLPSVRWKAANGMGESLPSCQSGLTIILSNR